MSEKMKEHRLEALFSDSPPEPDPSREPGSEGGALDDAALLESLAVPPESEEKHPRTLNIFLAGSIIGEAVAVAALIVVLYRSFPHPLRDVRFLITSASFAGMTLVLLFVQWQLAKRLAQVEHLVRKRNQQLRQAVPAIQRYQKAVKLANLAIRRQEMDWELCTQITRLVARRLAPERLASQVVKRIQQHFDPCFVGLFVLDADQREATLWAAAGSAEQDALARLERVAVSDSALLRECVDRGQGHVVQDVGARVPPGGDRAQDRLLVAPMGSAMIVPVMVHRRALGGITVQKMEPPAFQEQDMALMTLVAALAAIVMDNTRHTQPSF